MKPFIETLRVTNPVRQSRASSRKRVLRGRRATPLRSVDSEIKRCVIEPRNYPRREPSSWSVAGAEPGNSPGPISVPGHAGVGGTWRMITRVSRELGRPCRLHRDSRPETPVTNSRMIHSSRPALRGRTGTQRWYRQAKETKRGEMDGKESQHPIVAMKRGNGPSGPRGAKGVPRCGRGLEPRRGHRASPACHRETTQSCEGQRFHNVTNRVHLTCTPGSWELQGVIPGRPGPGNLILGEVWCPRNSRRYGVPGTPLTTLGTGQIGRGGELEYSRGC